MSTTEARLYRLDEIHRPMAVWLEYAGTPMVRLAIGGASAQGCRCFIDEWDMALALPDAGYNVRWRAWSAEPTEEQREAEAWDN